MGASLAVERDGDYRHGNSVGVGDHRVSCLGVDFVVVVAELVHALAARWVVVDTQVSGELVRP